MDKITTEKVMDKLDMIQSRSGKIYKFGCWDLERILADSGTQFTSKEFQDTCQTCSVHLTLVAPENQEIRPIYLNLQQVQNLQYHI